MTTDQAIAALVEYGVQKDLVRNCDRIYTTNLLLDVMGKVDFTSPSIVPTECTLEEILSSLLKSALESGVLSDNGTTSLDLFDTKLMSCLTPRPGEVIDRFWSRYQTSPREATDWFYRFCKDVGYIRQYRVEKDVRWKYDSKYGPLDITINLSKPEKDPKAIAAARNARQSGYPKCQLCLENEGYAGTLTHPARQNLRIIPITLGGTHWGLQYSPYSYYNEHCIALNAAHVPMRVERDSFVRLFDFVKLFPHYFVGSNADLPIVGGSILSHDHFQGGCYTFAMETAPIETPVSFAEYPDVEAGIVRWPLSVLRLKGELAERLVLLADRVLTAWRGYSDPAAGIFSQTDGMPHNTVTPIARRRGELFELDLVLRNNLTTEDRPLGVFHPRPELHHIKKENIGLIEVMGLAVLPARLKTELQALRDCVLAGDDPAEDPVLEKHAKWMRDILSRRRFTTENANSILREEVGAVFENVLEDAGVYKCTGSGRAAFQRFLEGIR